MGKCIKSIALSVIAAVFAVISLSGPVFASSANPTPATNTPETSETTTPETTTPENAENAETTENAENANNSNTANNESTVQTSCYDQVGSLGWIVCPSTGLFGNIIDGAYNILTNLIRTDPIPTDNNSPLYIVWDYFKNITNTLFIAFFLFVIFSQITGIGINNYGIKKILPRLVITAILVNLSYIICTLAVDISNIIGANFYSFFENVQNIAIQNGAISSVADTSSVSAVIATILGVGAGGAVLVSAAALGSYGGILWFLLPILLAGVVAVLSAAITMAARQALIFLLVMASPLAFIAYMLPNTEQLYKKWYSMLLQMLIFYPMFSVLYGASQLCGLVIISSAITAEGTDYLRVILGIAVKILPLFLSIPLMRMSNSVLGKISGMVQGITNPALRAAGRVSAERRELSRQRQLGASGIGSKLPSTRLAKFLENNRVRRDFDTKEQASLNADTYTTNAMRGWYNRKGRLNRRGARHNYNEAMLELNAIDRLNIATDFDEGFKTDGTDSRINMKRKGVIRAVNNTNRIIDDNVINKTVAETRQRVVTLNNIESRAKKIHDEAEKSGSRIHQQVLDSFHIDRQAYDSIASKKAAYDEAADLVAKGKTLTAVQQAAYNGGDLTASEKRIYDNGQTAVNRVLADAVAAKRKVDHEARSTYLELYDDYESGPRIKQQLIRAFQNKDYSSMSAALEVMYKRGDKDDIGDVLKRYSKEVYGEENIRFQKELNDICLSFKAEDVEIAQWAKANMMRRGMNGKDFQIEAYIDYEKWAKGETLRGDLDTDKTAKTSRLALGAAMSSWDPIATADRTMWNQLLDDQKEGLYGTHVDASGNTVKELAIYPIKYLRSAVCSGKMDGERLESFNKWFTGGFDKTKSLDDKKNAFFKENQEQYARNILEFLGDMTAPQLATLKTATLVAMNEAMMAIDGSDGAAVVYHNGKKINKRLDDALKNQVNQLNSEKSMASIRTGMNPAVREMLDIKDVI